ncbi:MAG: hypothetical protein K2H89_09945 [Oscillospiraceae bacterium]|nr:hypothetical protein [Oscillospiraceae bacterium]
MAYLLDDQEYHLHYNLGRLEKIEQAAGMTAVTLAVDASVNGKYPPISVVKHYFAMGLLNQNGVYAPLKKALEFAEKQIQESGYLPVMMDVVNTLSEDCGFLFQNGSSN